MIIKQNKLSVLHVIWYSMLLFNGLILVKDIFYQCLYNMLYGSTITLPMLRSVYHHKKYGWATSKCTNIFSITTPGVTPIIFFLQSWKMAIIFPIGNPTLVVVNILEHILYIQSLLGGFTIPVLETSAHSFTWFMMTTFIWFMPLMPRWYIFCIDIQMFQMLWSDCDDEEYVP